MCYTSTAKPLGSGLIWINLRYILQKGSIREAVMDSLQVHNVALSEKYLGMPSDVGVSTNRAFKYLKDRVWKRVQGWLEHTLSSGGKEVLIKSVAQAIPTFSMSCFRLPRGLCQHIDNLLRSFWWGSKDGKRKTCWVAWEEMAKPKYMVGMGFRDRDFQPCTAGTTSVADPARS